MGIEASHVFADGDIDYIENLNNIREEVVDLANGVNDSTIRLTNSGSNRWVFSRNGTESGSSAGSDLHIASYNDSGVLLGVRLAIDRSSGNVMIGTTTDDGSNKLQVTGNTSLTGTTNFNGNTILAGNLSFSGNSRRITADFTNATASSRTIFQTSTSNGETYLNAAPNGSATGSRFTVNNSSDVMNTSIVSLGVESNRGVIETSTRGTGTAIPLAFSINNVETGRAFVGGRWYFGASPVDDGVNTVQIGGSTSVAGNLTVSGSNRKILADFTNPTANQRVYLQTTSSNSATLVNAAPSGSSTTSNFTVNNRSDLDNSAIMSINIDNTDAALVSSFRGTGTVLPLGFRINSTYYGKLFTAGRWYFGASPVDDGVNTVQIGGSATLTGNMTLPGAASTMGIGIASPAERLHISGSGSQRIRITETGSGLFTHLVQTTTNTALVAGGSAGDNYLSLLTTSSGASTEKMRIFSNGRTFIGISPVDDGVNTLQVGGSTTTNGNLTLSGLGRRIVADFSDATQSNRTAFQSSVTNGVSVVAVIPNGTNTQSIFRVVNSSAYNNAATGSVGINNASFYIDSNVLNAGSAVPMEFKMAGNNRAVLYTTGRWYFGTSPADDGVSTVNIDGPTKTKGLTSISATAGVGYGTGAGGNVTQLTSKSTGVTLDKVCGSITMHNASLAANTAVSFTLTNSTIAATDVVVVSIRSGATLGAYVVEVDAEAAGSCTISVRNMTGGSLSEAIVLNFVVIKAVTS